MADIVVVEDELGQKDGREGGRKEVGELVPGSISDEEYPSLLFVARGAKN